jgi:hypothetical protein
MRNKRLEKENIENIGRKVIAAGALRETEIERIAAREDLFAGVLARVNSAPAPAAKETFSFTRFVRRHELGIGGAMAAILCVGVLGLYLSQAPGEMAVGKHDVPPIQPETARHDIVQKPIVDEPEPVRAQAQPDVAVEEPSAPAEPAVERAVYRQHRPSAPVRPQRASTNEAAGPEFMPVTYTGDNGESARGGRVIRVDVSRATLFAMGINVPLENESPTVKADLLVGPDGVTRAIRLVE